MKHRDSVCSGPHSHVIEEQKEYLASGLDLWMVVEGDVVCLLFCTLSFVRALFSFSFSRSLSFFSFFFLSTWRGEWRV